jgi:hypothetical protein
MASERDLEIEALKERIAKLEDAAKPKAPFKPEPMPQRDLTERASMPPSALRAMAEAIPSVMVREIVSGGLADQTLKPLATNVRPSVGRSGWLNPAPLDVPGIALADKLVDAQDARDRAELIEKEARTRMTKTA